MSDIVERLRRVEGYDFRCEAGPLERCQDWIDLKEELTRLRAEKAELTKENERLRSILVQAHNEWRHQFVVAVEDAAGTLFARLSHTNTDPFARADSHDPSNSGRAT